MRIPFIGPSYISRSRNISYDECINYYPEISEQQTAKNVKSLIGTPGLASWDTPTADNGRGTYQPTGIYKSYVYGVIGNTVYKWDVLAVSRSTVGTIGSYNGEVHFADNGSSQSNTHLLLVDGYDGYIIDMSTDTLTKLTSATHGFPSSSPTWCTFQDGYFIVNDNDSLTCYHSDFFDGLTWSSLNDFTVESTPDNCNAVIAHDGNLWAFGLSGHEVFYNTGNSSQYFVRIPGSPSDVGLIAPDSLAYNGSNLFWVGANRHGSSGIYMSNGMDGVPISTFSIENDIGKYDITNAIGYCYTDEGHNFYVVSFPTGNKTWVYDATTNYWHRRTHLNSGNENRHRVHRAINVNPPNGRIFVLGQDWETGQLYKLDLDTYSDNGDEIRRVRSCPTIHSDRQRLSFASFQVDMETGVGLATGQGSDPKGIIQMSNDSGHTFGNEIEVSLGKIGNYTHRAKINRLGQGRDRVFRFVCSEPIKQVLVGGYAEASLDG